MKRTLNILDWPAASGSVTIPCPNGARVRVLAVIAAVTVTIVPDSLNLVTTIGGATGSQVSVISCGNLDTRVTTVTWFVGGNVIVPDQATSVAGVIVMQELQNRSAPLMDVEFEVAPTLTIFGEDTATRSTAKVIYELIRDK